MLIFDVFFLLFSNCFACHAWNITQLQILTLPFKNNILGNKKIKVCGKKTRVGRVIGDEHLFLGLEEKLLAVSLITFLLQTFSKLLHLKYFFKIVRRFEAAVTINGLSTFLFICLTC